MAKQKRKQKVTSDDNISGSNKRSSTFVGGEADYIDLIPLDLFNDILSRLPLKCKIRCRCVSKHWSSKIPAQRFLLAFNVGSNLLFYSSPQPQEMDANSSVNVVATCHGTNLGTGLDKLCRPVHGLVCSKHKGEKNSSWAVISNPITGDYVNSPKVSIDGALGWIKGKAEYSFGYDPIDRQFKVLRITWLSCKPERWCAKYHVLTLETGKKNLSWRRIQCCAFHYPVDDNGICINGVLYYPAMIHNKTFSMVCFDVRSEKFSFADIDQGMVISIGVAKNIDKPYILVNYKGKLCVTGLFGIYRPYIELWVLEDAEKHKWSNHVFDLHVFNPLPDLMRHKSLVGMNGTEEIVLSSVHPRDPFVIYYYNLKTKYLSRVRVEVPVVDVSKSCRIYTFPNFLEDVKLM